MTPRAREDPTTTAASRCSLPRRPASPLVVAALGAPSLAPVVAFVLLLTAGDALYNPRWYEEMFF